MDLTVGVSFIFLSFFNYFFGGTLGKVPTAVWRGLLIGAWQAKPKLKLPGESSLAKPLTNGDRCGESGLASLWPAREELPQCHELGTRCAHDV